MNNINTADNSAYKLTHAVYTLLNLSFFVAGFTLIIAVIINYAKRNS